MNIKRYIARNSREALRMVKKDMGPEAVILKTKTIRLTDEKSRQLLDKVEVTAAVDYDAPVVMESERQGARELKGLQQLERDIKEIKEAVMHANEGVSLMPEVFFNQELRNRFMNYRTFGLSTETIKTLMADENDNSAEGEQISQQVLQESLASVLSRIKIPRNTIGIQGRKIYSFIGPTGVGKTTTLAKLAAKNAMEHGKKTALITLDTFRIAAVAQLQTYARIMGLPIEVVVNSEDLHKAIQKHNDCDRIFIDTAGRSPNADGDITELRSFFQIPDEIHSYLVLSATSQYENLVNFDERFSVLPVKSYIFTKLDEAQDASTMINFLIAQQKPVSYFTTGQQVPEDIEAVTKKRVAALLLSGMKKMDGNIIKKGAEYGSSCRP